MTGLTTNTIFANAQATGFQCGHNVAGWCNLLRERGIDFATLPRETAMAVNTAAVAIAQQALLGYDELAQPWLSGDEILTLIKLNNADGPGTHPSWVYGPAPLAYFYSFYGAAMASPTHHGRVHIMVVNTDSAGGGVHWFVVAFRISPNNTNGPSGSAQTSAAHDLA
jgi:hypothetical protein